MDRHTLEKSDDFIEKIIDMPVIVGISEFTDYAKGKINELHMGRITQCFPFYTGQTLRNCRCVIVIDEPLSIGNFVGHRLIVSERYVMGHPDILLRGEGWTVYISLLEDGAEVPEEITQETSEMLYLGFGSIKPPDKWDELIESVNRNLKYMTNEERIAAMKMKRKIHNFFEKEERIAGTKMKRGFLNFSKSKRHR